MAKTKPRRTKPVIDDKPQIPELADERDETLIRAAKRYCRERDARIAANDEEKKAHEHLLDLMTEKGIVQYQYKDLQIFVDTSRKCKVKSKDAENNGVEEE